MKSLVLNLIAVVLLAVSATIAAAAEVPVKIKVAGAKSIELSLGEISGKVWISFKDQNGNVFYSKKIKDLSSYTVKYDLAAFPDGEYQLELNGSDQTLNIPVTISKGILVLKEAIVSAPIVANNGNVVAVKLSGDTKNAWNIIIKNTAGDLIFIETVENSSNAQRKYDLSNLNAGEYTLQFSTAGNSFSHQVMVKN